MIHVLQQRGMKQRDIFRSRERKGREKGWEWEGPQVCNQEFIINSHNSAKMIYIVMSESNINNFLGYMVKTAFVYSYPHVVFFSF